MTQNEKKKSIHFVGIGGESMSALAKYAKSAGYTVSGSDKCRSQNIKNLKMLGIKVNVPHEESAVLGKDLVIKSLAVSDDNAEIIRAKLLAIPVLTRGEFLGVISKRHKYTVAVAGSHGKSTTAAMTAKLLLDFGLDPAVHIGADFPYIGGNVRYSESPYFITEACEYKKAFLSLSPFITVITGMELDHPDCYKNADELYAAYKALAENTRGIVLISPLDKGKICVKNAVTVGIDKSSYYGAENLSGNDGKFSFDFRREGKIVGGVLLSCLGVMSVKNALFALAVSDIVGVPFSCAKRAIEGFNGITRRQERLFDGKYTVYTDYSHHPTQIKNIASCFAKRNGRLIGVFQPHTYSRTKAYMSDFVDSFELFDKIYLLPTFAAREVYDEEGSSKRLFEEIKNRNKEYVFENRIIDRLLSELAENDVVLFMGAGDIDKLAQDFAKILNKYVAKSERL